MLAHGNGNPETCAANLLRLVRGEVPFDRVRGRDGTLIDQPNSSEEIIADAEWLLETYEPRVDAESVELSAEAIRSGEYSLLVGIAEKEEEDDE